MNLIKRTLLILMLCALSRPLVALDLGTIRDEIRVRIKDVGTSGQRRRFTDVQLNSFINQTQRDIVNVTWAVKKSTDFLLVENTTFYTMPTDFITVERLVFENRNLEESSINGLDSRFNNADWRTTDGFPEVYFRDTQRPDEIGFYPFPDDSGNSTGTVVMGYFAIAPDLSSDTDEPFDAINRLQQYGDILVYEPVYKVFLIEGEPDKALEYRSYYEARLELMVSLEGQRPNFKPGFSSQRQ